MEPGITELTRGLAGCDEHAWRVFHDRYYALLRTRAIARGVPESDAPEVVQGVYLRVMRHAKTFREDSAFEAWLSCLTRCEAIDLARRTRRRSWLGEKFQQWQEVRRAGSGSCGILDEALAALGETDRSLVTRHYLEGWSQEELASEQGTSVKAVESKLARLRRRLRRNLENIELLKP